MSCVHTLYPRPVNYVGSPTLPGPSRRTRALRGLDGHFNQPPRGVYAFHTIIGSHKPEPHLILKRGLWRDSVWP